MKKCCIAGCKEQFRARNFCQKHYDKWRRHGDPLFQKVAKGYVELKIDGRRILEHRYVMEQFLGRRLTRLEYIHHKNHDIRDNRIENLELMTPGSHNILHFKDVYINPNNTASHKQCPTCKKIYHRDDPYGFGKDKINRGGGLSRQCKACARAGNIEASRKYRQTEKFRQRRRERALKLKK